MGMGFEVTKEDVFTVMRHRMGITDVEFYSREVEDAFDIVADHADHIEECALIGDDLDEQTSLAHDAIEEILRKEVYG
jgi:hypothetical protein